MTERASLPELDELHRLIEMGGEHLRVRSLGKVDASGRSFDLLSITMGNPAPDAPAVGYFGGVHGLERIGSEVVIAYLGNLVQRLRWDSVLHHQLASVRMVFMPMVNPGGMWLNTRANPNGVDLMRNAPLCSQESVPFLLGGQRLSPALPWYRGEEGRPMQDEAQALCDVVMDELCSRRFSMALDCHSGFGWQDQIWFPYAYRRRPMRRIGSVMALKLIWEQAYPNHTYRFEPQSAHYLTHGDLWDYFYKQVNRTSDGVFLPLTLEMGSWRWIRKRPRQLFRLEGFFNPLVPHRHQRVLRSHMPWIDFLLNAAASHENWLPGADEESMLREAAIMHWYRDSR